MQFPLPVVQSPRLRQSSIYDYRSCPRKFLLRHRCNLTAKSFGFKRSLDVGTFFHELMASLFRTGSTSSGETTCQTLIEDRVLAAGDSVEAPDLVRLDAESALALAKVMVDIFWDMYAIDLGRWEVVEVEEVVRNDWAEGIPDVVLRDRRNGDLWLVDHKTEGRDGLVRSAPLTFELQPRLYRMLLQEKYNQPIVGVLHNIVVKCPLKFGQEDRPFRTYKHTLLRGPRKGQVEDRKEFLSDVPEYGIYLDRVRQWYLAEGDYFLLAEEREKNPPMLQSWTRFPAKWDDLELGAEIQSLREKTGHFEADENGSRPMYVPANWELDFPRHDNACRAYGSVCEFIDLCTSDPATWPEKVAVHYKQRPADDRYKEPDDCNEVPSS